MAPETQSLLIDGLKEIKAELKEMRSQNEEDHHEINGRITETNERVAHLEHQVKFMMWGVGGAAFISGLIAKELIPYLFSLLVDLNKSASEIMYWWIG